MAEAARPRRRSRASSGSLPRPSIERRSIFSVCTGSTFRCASDDWPGAEVVDADAHAAARELRAARRSHASRLSMSTVSVISSTAATGRGRVAASTASTIETRSGSMQLAGREVHRDRQRRRRPATPPHQRAACAHASCRTHAPIGTIKPGLLGDRRGSRPGRAEPALGVLPAHERLEADHLGRSKRTTGW